MVAPLVELERDNTRARSLAEPCRVCTQACRVQTRFSLSIRKSKRTDFEGDCWSLVSFFFAIKNNRVLVLDCDCWPLVFWRLSLMVTVGLWTTGDCWSLVFWRPLDSLSFGYLRRLRGLALVRVFPLPQFRILECLLLSLAISIPARRVYGHTGRAGLRNLVLEGLHERGRIRFLGSVRATARCYVYIKCTTTTRCYVYIDYTTLCYVLHQLHDYATSTTS